MAFAVFYNETTGEIEGVQAGVTDNFTSNRPFILMTSPPPTLTKYHKIVNGEIVFDAQQEQEDQQKERQRWELQKQIGDAEQELLEALMTLMDKLVDTYPQLSLVRAEWKALRKKAKDLKDQLDQLDNS